MNAPIRILLVDDSPQFLEVASDYLGMNPAFEVAGMALNAQDALTEAKRLQPDVILLDLNLGSQSGITLIPQFKAQQPRLKVIILTLMSDNGYAIAAQQAGADGFIPKARMTELLVEMILALTASGANLTGGQKFHGGYKDVESIFMRLAEQSNDVIYRYEFTPQRGFTYISPAVVNMTGYTPEELYADPKLGSKLIHPEDRLIWESLMQGEFTAEQPITLRWVGKDETPTWTEQQGINVFNEAGELTAVEGIARDITQRKQAEEQLRESEERLELVMEGSQLGFWDWDIETNVVHRNARWAEMLGYTLEEIKLTVKQWTDLHHPDDRESVLQSIQDHLDGKTPAHRIEYRMRAKNGTYKWILDQARVVKYDAQGKPLRMSGTHTDITERKRAERALQESETRFESVFHSNPAAIAITSLENNQLADVNTAWEELTGYTKAEIIGRTPRDLNLWVKPAQRDKMLRLLEEQGKVRMDVTLRHKSGEFRELLLEAEFVKLADKPYLLTMAQDITESKQAQAAMEKSQALLSALIESSAAPIFSVDREYRYTIFNQAHLAVMKDLYGAKIETGGCVLDYINADADKETTRANLSRALNGERFTKLSSSNADARARRYFEAAYHPIHSKSEEVTGVSIFAHDVTEIRAATEQNRIQTTALESAANAVVITDNAGNIQWVNSAWCALTGHTFEEGLKKNPRILKSGRQDETFYKDMWDTILAGKVWRGELVNKRKDGSFYDEEETITPVFNEDGEITHFIGIKQNISNRKRDERLLRSRLQLSATSPHLGLDEFLQKTLDEAESLTESQIGFFHFVEGDQETIALQAWSTNTLKNMCQAEGKGKHYPKEQAGVWAEALTDRQSHIYNDCPSLPNRKGLPEGHAPMQRFMVVPLIRQDKVVALFGVGNKSAEYHPRDVDTLQQMANEAWEIILRKRTEMDLQRHLSELEALYQNGQAISQLMNEKEISQKLIQIIAQKLEWHHTAVRVYQPESNRVEMLAGNFPDGESDKLQNAITSLGQGVSGWVIQHGEGVRLANVKEDARYAETYPEIRSGLYIPIQSGQEVLGCVTVESERENAFTEDNEHLLLTLANQVGVAISKARLFAALQSEVTERRLVEEQMRHLNAHLEQRIQERTSDLTRVNKELEHAMRVKDEFLASMSHELRTPLTGILGFSETLQLSTYGALNEKQTKSVRMIAESGHHLLDLINDILDLAKVEAGKLELEIARLSLDDVCQASLQLTKGMSGKKRQHVNFTPLPEPIYIQADQRRLKQILVNLLSNAIKFTPENGELGLEVSADTSAGNITLTVWDKGIGIEPGNLHRLFKPFEQIDNRLAREYTGTGLGLSLVRQLVELHHGTINVESVFGEGSRFTVTLPWSPTQSSALAADEISGQSATIINPATSTHLPLLAIADDDDVNVQMVSDFFISRKFRVVSMCRGSELLERISETRPDIVLLDIQMPGMDGFEVARRIRAHADARIAATPIIAITALAMTGDRERCLAAGANEYLSKPVRLLDLYHAVQNQIMKKGVSQ